MHKNTLLVAALFVTASLPALAGEAPAITGNAGFVSDYVFNGISQTYRSPAFQGGFDYAQGSGVYVGTWASNISGNQYTNANLEWDVYGGYNGKVNDDLGYQLGFLEVMYPGGKAYNATPNTYKKWDTVQVILGATWKTLNVKYTHTLTSWYGIDSNGFTPILWASGASTADGANVDSKGSGYIELNYTYELTEGLTLAAHAGHQRIRNFSALSYTDYKLALSKGYAGFNFGLAFTTTNATDNSLYHVMANGDDKKLGGRIVAVSVARSF